MSLSVFKVGDRVCVGRRGSDDFERGRVVAVCSPAVVRVAWESHSITYADVHLLDDDRDYAFEAQAPASGRAAARAKSAELLEPYICSMGVSHATSTY